MSTATDILAATRSPHKQNRRQADLKETDSINLTNDGWTVSRTDQ